MGVFSHPAGRRRVESMGSGAPARLVWTATSLAMFQTAPCVNEEGPASF